ncbi:ATP-binding protein [Sphingobium sp. EM0848]|uniref:HAMP domain-containing sensor histidine kinase n=1 Tax=Sphingobium sp. EM0848 TaxID=2743473 RepID=UPI00159C944F|nr:ATP-binding protein [Sphingobium sp. EM0848]
MARFLRSAAYRIALVYALGFAAATLLLGIAVILFAHAAFMRQLEAQIVEDSGALVAEFRQEGHEGLNFAIREREAGNTTNELLYAVFARDGRRIAGGLHAYRPPVGWSDLDFQDRLEGPDVARAWAVDLNDGTRLVVGADRSVVDRVDHMLGGIFLAAFAVVLLLSLTGALLLGAYLRRRLSAISRAADSIMAGDINRRVPASGRQDEFDALAHSLNQMLDRITGLLENLRQLSGDIAHDLRTPLARLRNHLEDSLDAADDPVRQGERLSSALEQADKVLALFAAILRISEIEGGRRRASFRTVDLSMLAAEICETYAPAVEEGGRRLRCDVAAGTSVHGDPELLAQAIINLLDNAQVHTPEGACIDFLLERDANSVRVMVRDDGPGVPTEARDAIFRRFVRLDRGRNVPGHGLGLNMVAAIVAMHDGRVEIGDNAPGLRIGFLLPAGI